jgi:membrane protease YdiL (CAAX protease family)
MRNFRDTLGEALNRNGFLLVLFSFLMYLSLLLLVGGLVFWILGSYTGLDLGRAQMELLAGAGPDSQAAGVFRAFQGTNQLVGYGLTSLIIAWLLGQPRKTLQLDSAPAPPFLLLSIGIMVASIPLVQVTIIRPEFLTNLGWEGEFIQGIIEQEEMSQNLLVSLFVEPTFMGLLANLLIFAVFPAFCEEAFFRGVLQTRLQKHLGPHWGIWLAAAIFSFIHFQFLGFFSRWLLGALLGYFVYYSGSLWPGIFAHFCFNATSVIGAYYYPEMADANYQFGWEPVFVALFLVGTMGALYLRLGRQRLGVLPESSSL